MKTLLMAFFYLTLMAYPAKAPVYSPSPFDMVFGHCGIRDPCFIAPNNGGQVYLFVQAARAVNRGEKNLVVINTTCASACALFADRARERVCIGELAVFQFHKGTRLHWTGFRQYPPDIWNVRFDPPQSPDIDSWIRERGGYPADGWLDMTYQEARRFWRPCDFNSVLPRPDPRGSF